MFEIKPLARGIAVAFGGLACAMVVAGPARGQTPVPAQKLDRVEITGSAIKRVEAETAQPVEIYTKKEIERTGATNLNEFIRNIPSVDIFDQGELASNSPAGSGTASVNMRGLSDGNVLVLLNGRRLPVNALYDSSGAGAAVDINTIPISAIERIEILKDGGSAIYGADAVAGVFNIITRRDYQGIEARAGFGESAYRDGKEYSAGLAFGFGDLSKDKFNIFGGIDYFKRDPIYRKDRDISRSVDYRRFGSSDGRSGFSPAGNILNPATGNFANIPYTDCSVADQNPSGRCRYDFNASLLTAYNGAERYSGMLTGTVQLTPTMTAFADVVYSESKNTFEAHPVPDYFLVPWKAGIPDSMRANADFEADPAGQSVIIAGRFMQGGPRTTERKGTLLNLATGLEGSNFGLDWKFYVNYGESKVTNKDSNYFDANKWSVATASGLLNPTVMTNDPAFVESLKVNPVREGKSTLTSANLQAGGEAFNLPAGPVLYAVGGSFWREELKDTPDELTQQGLVVGSIAQSAVDASRNVYALFGELAIPVVKNVEASVAARYDHYENESKVSPKVGLKWNATKNLMFRGSYTESFRAPVLKQLYGAQEQGAITIEDPAECVGLGQPADCNIPAYQVNGSNPDLKSETAKTYNFGIVGDVGPLSASLDYWKIQKEDVIDSPTILEAIQQGKFVREQGRYLIYTNLQNFAKQEVSGIDLDARLTFRGTALGTLTLRDFVTYYFDNKTFKDGTGWENDNGTYATPRWRNSFSAVAETGPWAFSTLVRTVAGFYDSDEPSTINSSTRRVASHTEVDIQTGYTGIKSLQVVLGIKNLFDRQPPFSRTNATSNAYTQMGFAELYNNRGRFFYGTVMYKFR